MQLIHGFVRKTNTKLVPYNEAVSIIYYPIQESGSLKQIKLFKLYAKQRMHPLNMDLSCSF